MELSHKNTVCNILICILPEKRDKDWQVYIDYRDISIWDHGCQVESL